MRCLKCGEISENTKFCPNCGAPMPETRYASPEDSQPEWNNDGNDQSNEKKKNSKLSIFALIFSISMCLCPVGIILAIIDLCKKDKRTKHNLSIAALIISAIVLIIGFIYNGSSGNKTTDNNGSSTTQEGQDIQNGEKEYVSDSIDVVSSNPDSYKGKYITFDVRSIDKVQEDGDTIYYQAYTDTSYGNSVIIEAPKDTVPAVTTSDYAIIDGKIDGTYSGTTIVGVDKDWAYIVADSITPSTYTDTFGKADATWDFADQIISQNGVDIQVTKVEFNSIETRFYVTVSNNSSDTFNVWSNDAKIVQGGQQYEETYNMDADYPVLSTSLLPGATSSGVLVFPVVSQSEMQLHIEGASDDWETEFQPFEFTLSN